MPAGRLNPEEQPEARHKSWGWHLFVAGAFVFLTIPRMAQAGMFLDGVTYASISRNLAAGIGSFWHPAYTSTLYPRFHEQPPLGLALQAAAFAVFGDHLFVERAYSFIVGILIAILILRIWDQTVGEPEHGWLPLVFWLLPSTVTWSIVNNMLENTQTLFTTAAVLAFILSLRAGGWSRMWAIASGLCVLGAVLTKGPVGLFPLLAPAVAAVVMREHRVRALASGAMMAGAVGAGAVVVLWPAASRDAMHAYWEQQVAASISGARGGGRWVALLHHLTGGVLMRMGGLFALMCLGAVIRKDRPNRSAHLLQARWAWFFLLLGLAGSVPVAFSAKIVGHYFVPSAPIFACGFAILALHFLRPVLERARHRPLANRIPGGLGAALIVISAAMSLTDRIYERRDRDWIAEYNRLSPAIPRALTMGTCMAADHDWSVHAYMQRFYRVSLDANATAQYPYFLELRDRPCQPPPDCRPRTAGGRLVLLECPGTAS